MTKEHLRYATAEVVDKTLRARLVPLWGEDSTACAFDARHFGAVDTRLDLADMLTF